MKNEICIFKIIYFILILKIICSTVAEYFFENIFYSFYNNRIMFYCANFYGRCFIRVYEDKMPVIKVCTVQHYPIIAVHGSWSVS